jgi:hypothetical protein
MQGRDWHMDGLLVAVDSRDWLNPLPLAFSTVSFHVTCNVCIWMDGSLWERMLKKIRRDFNGISNALEFHIILSVIPHSTYHCNQKRKKEHLPSH